MEEHIGYIRSIKNEEEMGAYIKEARQFGREEGIELEKNERIELGKDDGRIECACRLIALQHRRNRVRKG
jgi:hypothetical protein